MVKRRQRSAQAAPPADAPKRAKQGGIKGAWRTVKDYLDSDGILPWLANLAIAFLLIKFIIYPVLGWLFGTGLPVVAVVSSSMDHAVVDGTVCGQHPSDYDDDFDGWWNTCGGWYEQRGITKETFKEYPYKNGFDKGDIMVLFGPSRASLKQGDILVFQAQENYPIIHRIVSENVTTLGTVYGTKGDHNPAQINEYVSRTGQPVTSATPGAIKVIDETTISEDVVIGKAVLRIPWIGYVKIWFSDAIMWIAGR